MSDGVWTPRYDGGAVLAVGGVVVVEIEPLGAGSDGCGGTLAEAKVRALEMLCGDRLAVEVSDGG